MNPVLTVFVLLDACVLAVWALIATARRGRSGVGLVGPLVLLELTVVVQAAVHRYRLLDGATVPDPATHVGYLLAAVAVLPLLLALTTGPRHAGARLPAASTPVITVACVTLAIVQLRLIATGPAPPFS